MKKYKEWLTNVIEIMESETSENYPHEQMVEREVVLNLINQPDEPETLSIDKEQLIKRIENYIPLHYQTVGDVVDGILGIVKQLPEMEVLSPKWIDDNTQLDMNPTSRVVPAFLLENILVSKQELPVIPKYVAEYLDFAKKEASLIEVLVIVSVGWPTMKKEFSWILANDEAFARAWLNGYEVEEQKYYVSERDEEYGGFWFLSKNNNGNISIGVSRDWSEVDWDRLKLTEQEIKDYDPRYWAFRKPVEELEE